MLPERAAFFRFQTQPHSPAVAHGEAGFLVIWQYLVVLINCLGDGADRLVSEL